MKTIRELQKEMRDTAAWLEEASRDLSDLQTSRETSGEQVNFQRLQALGERYPILNHCLKDKTSAFQQQYLTLLAGLLLAEPAHAQDGWLLLQRIIAGGGVRLSLEELQVDAATLTPEQMDGFTTAVFQDELGDALLLDGLLLCLTIGGGQVAWDYLSGLAELIRCPAERLQKLAALASGVGAGSEKADRGIESELGVESASASALGYGRVPGALPVLPRPGACLVGGGRKNSDFPDIVPQN